MICTCPNCGHTFEIQQEARGAKPRWEILNSGLVYSLIQAVRFVHKQNRNRFHLQHDLDLTKTQYNNFQKLRYHALLAHADKDNPKSGEWLITARGGAFLRGEIMVPRRVLVQDNHVIDHDQKDLIHINQLKHRYPDFTPIYAYAPCLMPQNVGQQKLFVSSAA